MWRRKPPDGGPIAFIETGDVITIDVEAAALTWKPTSRRAWPRASPRPSPNTAMARYAKYAKLVHSASDGAVTSFPFD
jgi:dihydroxy-acid dehydratase